jgi:hypothetical protein
MRQPATPRQILGAARPPRREGFQAISVIPNEFGFLGHRPMAYSGVADGRSLSGAFPWVSTIGSGNSQAGDYTYVHLYAYAWLL